MTKARHKALLWLRGSHKLPILAGALGLDLLSYSESFISVYILGNSEIESLLVNDRLSWADIIATCEQVFRWIGEGQVVQQHSSPMYYSLRDGHQAFALPFPACIKPLGIVGNKWGGGSNGNRSSGLRSFTASIILNDAETAAPKALLDANLITSMRTGGHAAVGAKYLARHDSHTIAVIGCGAEGGSFLCALNALFDIHKVNAVARRFSSAKAYADQFGDMLDINIEPMKSVQDAVRNADIISMCSSSSEPVLLDRWIRPGTHVAATRAFIDYDPVFSCTADKWVLGNRDSDEEWLAKPPFVGIPHLSVDNVYADMVEIVSGDNPGRENDDERTTMTHMGMGALDVAMAHEIYQRALAIGLGQVVDIH